MPTLAILIRFVSFTGSVLLEYVSMKDDAPEAFYCDLQKINMPLADKLQLSKALTKPHSSSNVIAIGDWTQEDVNSWMTTYSLQHMHEF